MVAHPRLVRAPVVRGDHPEKLLLSPGADTVLAVRIDDGLITGLYAVRNPEKLSRMQQETTLRR